MTRVAAAGGGLRVCKLPRLSQHDDKLANGIDYTYVEDKLKFTADGATLRFISVILYTLYGLTSWHIYQ